MINPTLTQYFKFLIKKEGLIDTGALLASIKVDVKFNKRSNTIQMNVIAQDYIKYLYQKYNLTQQFLTATVVQTEIEKSIKEPIEEMLAQQIFQQGIVATVPQITLRFTYNNRSAIKIRI